MGSSRPRRSKAGNGAPPVGGGPAWCSVRAIVIFLIPAVIGVAADLATKAWAFGALSTAGPRVLVEKYVRFTLSTNPGIVFGIDIPGWIVQIATLGAMGAVVALFAGSARRFWGLHAALGMVLGGALGNLYDRTFVEVALRDGTTATGRVRDFIDVTLPVIDYPWPVFNIADVLLVVGLGVIMLHVFRNRKDQTT